MSLREGVPTEGDLYDPWPCLLVLDPRLISWPSRDQVLQWHDQLIALPSESVTGGLIASRWGSFSSKTVVGSHP